MQYYTIWKQIKSNFSSGHVSHLMINKYLFNYLYNFNIRVNGKVNPCFVYLAMFIQINKK